MNFFSVCSSRSYIYSTNMTREDSIQQLGNYTRARHNEKKKKNISHVISPLTAFQQRLEQSVRALIPMLLAIPSRSTSEKRRRLMALFFPRLGWISRVLARARALTLIRLYGETNENPVSRKESLNGTRGCV